MLQISKINNPDLINQGVKYELVNWGKTLDLYTEKDIRRKFCSSILYTIEQLKHPYDIEVCRQCKNSCNGAMNLLTK
jgi:hypothetical protein